MLKVLGDKKKKKQKRKDEGEDEDEDKEEEDCDQMDDSTTSTPAMVQGIDMVDAASQPQSVDDALKVLVQNAVKLFGFTPRDMCDGVLKLHTTKCLHNKGVEDLTCSELRNLVDEFHKNRQLCGISHRVVAVYPTGVGSDHWEIDFKSAQIQKDVMIRMQSAEVKDLQETYDYLRKIPERSPLARSYFEMMVHRIFSTGWLDSYGSMPQPICTGIDPDCDDTLTIRPGSHPTPASSLPPLTPLHNYPRAATWVSLTPTNKLNQVTLDGKKYYIPTAASDPLFHSFTIDFDRNQQIVVISVFRIAISSSHGGSAQGYKRTHRIIQRVKRLLENANTNATVKVVYFLVCPTHKGGKSKRRWQMPAGWNKGAIRDDHHGGCFCICIPISGASRSLPLL